jgi:RTX calcium-binding nonapeptide repeat (4 copies)
MQVAVATSDYRFQGVGTPGLKSKAPDVRVPGALCQAGLPFAQSDPGSSPSNDGFHGRESKMKRALLGASAVAALLGFAVTAYAAVHVIPPSDYNPGCHPNGKALQGDRADDTIRGTARRDLLRGGGGADTIIGRPARDCLFGGDGRDLIKGGEGRDRIGGGAGSDALRGNKHSDGIIGAGGKDALRGNRGDDRLKGGNGDDDINGGNGDDLIRAGNGDDEIIDIRGRNRIVCGNGFDTVTTNPQSVTRGCEDVTRI